MSPTFVASLGITLLLAACAGTSGPPQPTIPDPATATFVGGARCSACHEGEASRWTGSHHDLAMEPADPTTVLGDFDGAVFRHNGVVSTFSRQGDEFWVRTEGADGEQADFRVEYTFGVVPLQQYLIGFPGGRYQSLGVAWDSRPEDEGGQRWFHLYPDERIPAGDELHWTSLNQNWNYMCAECHSTDLRKNYNAAEDRFETSWAEIDVSCEACHGPGSNHVQWGEARARGEDLDYGELMGLVFQLGARTMDAAWDIDPETGLAQRTPPLRTRSEIETCGRCHSRRSVQVSDYEYGRPLTDTHRVALLDEALYHADGQVLDEVYVYGSFLQSKMYREGVSCADCHEPHSLRVLVDGNGLCSRCHLAAKFDTIEHHFHEVGTEGAGCVDCHMPTTTYMVVDPRLDHSMRVPRPDLSAKLGTPDACSGCHADQSPQWAADQVAEWYGEQRRQETHYGEALAAGRRGDPDAPDRLIFLANDWEQPGIARATALLLLQDWTTPQSVEAIARALGNDDPLIRVGALAGLRQADPATRMSLAYPLLRDRNLSVRLRAARILLAVPPNQIGERERRNIAAAVDELVEALRVNQDRPEFLVSLGAVLAQSGRVEEAEEAYRTALRLEPGSVVPRVNLADLYRALGRDAEGEQLLRQALELAPESGDVHHALGLLLIRRNRRDEAYESLGRASELAPGNPRYALAYALMLQDRGDLASATQVLRRALGVNPDSAELLGAMVQMSIAAGERTTALEYARQLLALQPQNENVRELVQQLQEQQ